MVDVNPEKSLSSAGEDHFKERRSDVAEVDRGPEGRIAKSAASPLITNVKEGK